MEDNRITKLHLQPEIIQALVSAKDSMTEIHNVIKSTMSQINVSLFQLPKYDFINSEIRNIFTEISSLRDRIKSNPEFQFACIADLEFTDLLTYEVENSLAVAPLRSL